jgi:hypothetical protein
MPSVDPALSRSSQTVVVALGTWLVRHTIGHFTRMLIERLRDADHLEMWSILAQAYAWGFPLLWLAQRVRCLPASEADSERAVGAMQRALGDYGSQMADDTLRRRAQMAMSQTIQGAEG